jgi:murein DD-endopeptidase MepM/ murein hydrolase activator NlpD
MRGRSGWATVSRAVLVLVLAGGAGACSSDTMRFADTQFSNPFSSSARTPEPVTTGALNTSQVTAMPTSPVQVQALAAPVVSQNLAPVSQSIASVPASASTIAKSAQGLGGSAAGWSPNGGTQVSVGQGDTIAALSNRYGVPAAALLAANGLKSGQNLAPGSQITVPVYDPSAGTSARKEAPSVLQKLPKVEHTKPASVTAPVEKALPSQKLTKIDLPKAPGKLETPVAAVAKTDMPKVNLGKIDVAKSDALKADALKAQALKDKEAKAVLMKDAQDKAKAEAARLAALKAPKEDTKIAAVKPAEEIKASAAAKSAPSAKSEPAMDTDKTASLPSAASAPNAEFRWPAKGRVISGFGGAGSNEGINIAVPEGTPVKAAESGVVAYSGSELKGYGNLVLIRHDNGYVSAYAHNGELLVKRGERVKRGQVVSKSGQSGNVNAPQLHFEIRKGSTPVDPVPYLAGG